MWLAFPSQLRSRLAGAFLMSSVGSPPNYPATAHLLLQALRRLLIFSGRGAAPRRLTARISRVSISTDRSTLIRLNREIGDLRSKEVAELKKEADANKKANAALAQARKAASASSTDSYTRAAQRESKNAQAAQDRRVQYANQIATKSKEVAKVQDRITRAEAAQAKAQSASDAKQQVVHAKRQNANEKRIRDLEAQLAQQAAAAPAFYPIVAPGETEVHDVFISHAWADKADFVDGLAAKARATGLKVWYDKFEMGWGSNLRQEIDAGLSGAYFGVVVLSPSFFSREWAKYELDGLVQKDIAGTGRLLPIWHKLSHDDVLKHSPALAGRLALTSAMSTDEIVAELVMLRDRFRAVADRDVVSEKEGN